MINIIRQVLIELDFQKMLTLRKDRSLPDILHKKAVKRGGRRDIHIKRYTYISLIADKRPSQILHDHLWLHQLCPLQQEHPVQQGRILIRDRDRLQPCHPFILIAGDPAAFLLDHSVFFTLTLQRDPPVIGIIDTDPPFFPGADSALVFIQALVIQIVEINTPDQIAPVLIRMRIRSHDILKPDLKHLQLSS